MIGDKEVQRQRFRDRRNRTRDAHRESAVSGRHERGYRTARENLADLCDAGSFVEYGELVVAAQRSRREREALQHKTPADGVITGLATINVDRFGPAPSQAAVIVNDYTVLAGTQGYFHHKKLDRLLALVARNPLPVVMYTEGGGGRPGDTDVLIAASTLDVPTFAAWSALDGRALRIAVNNGYCFAGNAVLFGAADLTIATESSWIGMAGPAMIAGAGLGDFAADAIGPIDVQRRNGVVDIVTADEADATRTARQLLSYFQGITRDWRAADPAAAWDCMPADRRYAYDARRLIKALADAGSFLEIQREFGAALIAGFVRIEGRPMGLLCNDCRVLAGAIDAAAAAKAARFITLCDRFHLPILSLCDTPGFMVGPECEEAGTVRRTADMLNAGARATVPVVCIVLRRAYGLGAMAMAMGSLHRPLYTAAWPNGEFGAMGLEGAVNLGFRKELAAAASDEERQALYDRLLGELYEKGRAAEVAAYAEIDAVIEPEETRTVIVRALEAAQRGIQREDGN